MNRLPRVVHRYSRNGSEQSLRTSTFLRGFTAGAVVLAVAGSATVLSTGLALAQDEPPNLGTLTFTPAEGTDTSAIVARTSGGCTPENSDAFNVRVTGPSATGANDFNSLITPSTSAEFDRTGPFNATFANTMKDAAADQEPPKQLLAGTYTVTLNCIDSFELITRATYTGQLSFTSPTAYTQPAGTPTPTPTPSVTPTPTPTPSVTPTPTLSPGEVRSTTTMLNVFPSTAFRGLPVILIARVSSFAAGGTVQFKDGDTDIGNPVRVFGGFAFKFTSKLTTVGNHQLTAMFTPVDPTAYGPSTSNTVNVKVNRLWRWAGNG